MKLNYLRTLEKFTVIIYPEGTRTEAKSFLMNGRRMIGYLLIYTLLMGVAGFYIIYLTPLEKVFLPSWLKKTTLEEQQYEALSKKITLLATELENLKSANTKLRNAVQLGDSALLRNNKVQKNAKDSVLKVPSEGNIGAIFKKLYSNIFQTNNQVEDVFFILPVKGYLSREFKPEQGHKGLDFVVKENTPVYASAGGYVIFANYTTQFGFTMLINHSAGYISKYMHCNQLLKKEGDIVLQGELIALSGNSGIETTGPHLHFEIWKDGKPIDPKKVLINY